MHELQNKQNNINEINIINILLVFHSLNQIFHSSNQQ